MQKKLIVRIAALLLLCLFSAGIKSTVLAASEDEVITKGVYIDSVSIGGMTKEQAQKAVDEYIENLKSRKVTVMVEEASEEVTLKELGYEALDNNYIEHALQIGKSGNLIRRYKELKDTEEASLVYILEFKLDKDKVDTFIEEKLSPYDVEAESASVKRENGAFVYTDHKVGRKVEAEDTSGVIINLIKEDWNQQDLTLSAVVKEVTPKYTKADVEKCRDLLGTFSTTYTSSSENRAGNLSNGARLINNTVLYPGDVFSAYEKLTPFTRANGYYEAGAYANGMVIDSIGGGACQVTTTLYNAVLLSELEVVERAPHSMTVSYVDLSMDSAIAGTWKDLKFKNDQNIPILIEVYTQGRTITFNIWGYETRNKEIRKIKFETVVLSETKPGADVVTEDPTKPDSYQVTTQAAHTGYVAELYKIVYENGVEVSRTRVNKSAYNASPRYVTVGTMVEEEIEEEEPASETSAGGGNQENGQTEDSGNTSEKPDNKPIDNSGNNNADGNNSESENEGETPEVTTPDNGV